MSRHAAALKQHFMAELERNPFRPAWWLRSPHGQTLWPALFRSRRVVALEAENVPTIDDDVLDVHYRILDRNAPTVLILPGLESTIRSPYVQAFAARALMRQWNVSIVEYRGCGAAMNRTRRLYHSGATDDVDTFVQHCRLRVDGPLVLVGFSLGANLAGKWLGERGEESTVSAAALLAPPFDLARSADAIDRSLRGLYARHFVRSLIRKAIAKERQFPGCIDIERVRRARGIVEFDDHATAPLHGFRDAADYYARTSCGAFLGRIRVPTLLVAAEDDPYAPRGAFPVDLARQSPWLVPAVCSHGGHQGFVSGAWPWRAEYWAERLTLSFFDAAVATGA